MNPIAVLKTPFRYRPWRALPRSLLVRDLLSAASFPQREDIDHLRAAIDWLCVAQDVLNGRPDEGGVSAGWNFEDDWLPGYPETTGYIIETFIAAAPVLQQPQLVARAARMLDWELGLQQADGAFPGHFGETGSRPVIFNTGQIMHGLVSGYLDLGRTECLDAAVRAGHWLARHQDDDGCWRTYEHHGTPHVYNTRATWALARVAVLAGDRGLERAARRNLDWALTQQRPSGWFASNAFTPDRDPFTHTIAYAIRGLAESGFVLREPRYVEAARSAACAVAKVQRADGWLAGTYADGWRPTATYACVTGVAQMALCWQRLALDAGESALLDHAARAIQYVKTTQDLDHPHPIVRGGVPGSAPIWGAYSRFEFPNWAAKFFSDALLMRLTGAAVPRLALEPRHSAKE